jgi:hypothetical protein
LIGAPLIFREILFGSQLSIYLAGAIQPRCFDNSQQSVSLAKNKRRNA